MASCASSSLFISFNILLLTGSESGTVNISPSPVRSHIVMSLMHDGLGGSGSDVSQREIEYYATRAKDGDYLIPNIVIRKTKPIGHYGRLRKAYLKMHRPILFNELALSDKLFEHCAEIDEAARSRMELIVPELAKQYGVTEQLKAENQMEWVRQMNACKAQAEEIVKAELIYD